MGEAMERFTADSVTSPITLGLGADLRVRIDGELIPIQNGLFHPTAVVWAVSGFSPPSMLWNQ